jgi:hypothetical protein
MMRHVRLLTLLALTLLIALAAPQNARLGLAQTTSGGVQDASLLQLPASAFPAGYTLDQNIANTPADADGSFFTVLHSKTYATLGMKGGWYQYAAAPVFQNVNGVTFVTTIDLTYLGSYYADTTAAQNAFADVKSNPQLAGVQSCSFGAQCLIANLDVNWQGITYKGLAQVIQQGDVVAEIYSVTPDFVYDQVGAAQFASNVQSVAQAFVQLIAGLAPPNTPTSTPVPPTATSTSTPVPTSTPAPTATATSIPVSFDILSVRAEKLGSKSDPSLARAPLRRVKVSTKIYLSIYVLVHSAPADSSASEQFRVTFGGRTVFHRSIQIRISSGSDTAFRGKVSFKPTRPGTYRFRGSVTIGGVTKQSSTAIAAVS